MSERDDIERFNGKQIAEASRYYDDKYVRLRFTDGSECTFEGGGYDGLWDDVYIDWAGRKDAG